MVWREGGDPAVDPARAPARPPLGQRKSVDNGVPDRRVVGRKRALPSGRALFGGFLVAAAALVVFAAVLAGTGAGTAHNFVVASRSLQAGSVIEPGDLSMKSMRLPSGVAAFAFKDPGRVVGRTLAITISQGELLETSSLIAGTTSQLRPVTIPVDQASLVSLFAGEPVDVLEATGSSGSASITVVLRGVTLLAVSRGSSGLLSNPSASAVTLGVPTLDEVETVLAASHAGTLTLVAAEPSDGVGPGPGGNGSAGNGSGLTPSTNGAGGTGG